MSDLIKKKKINEQVPQKNPSSPSPLKKFQNIWICKYFSCQKFNYWRQDVHWRLQVSTSHLFKLQTGARLFSRLVVMSQNHLVLSLRFKLRFKTSTEKLSPFSRWMWNSAHTSVCTVNLRSWVITCETFLAVLKLAVGEQLLNREIPLSLVSACWFVVSSAAGRVNAAGDGWVLDGKLPWCRVSASVCRVVVEGGDPGGTVAALRGQDGGRLVRNSVCSCDTVTRYLLNV